MSQSQSAAPILGTMASAIQSAIKSTQAGPVDRALGVATSLGLSLAVLRLVGSTYNASRRLEVDVEEESSRSNSGGSIARFFASYMRRLLRTLLIGDESELLDDVDPSPSSCITHSGSCHCNSVVFEVLAPRCLAARDGTGKIQYRHTKVKTSTFRVQKGHECLKTYYVVSKGAYDTGAHAFCERCGVHVLYAPWKNSPHLFINVNCLAEGIRKVRVARGVDSIDDAVPAEGQWDDFDLFSTVSEVTRDSRWPPFHSSDATVSSTSDWNWKAQNRIEDISSSSQSISDYSFRKPHFSLSPTLTATTESRTSSEASFSALQDDRSSNGSTSFAYPRPITLLPKPSPRNYDNYSASSNQFASPELRDQMKYFMKKHISPTSTKNNAITSSQRAQSATTETVTVQ